MRPLTDVTIDRKRIVGACPSNDIRGRRLPTFNRKGKRSYGLTVSGTFGRFVRDFRMRKRKGGFYKLCKFAAFGTMHCFRGVPMGSAAVTGGSTPSVCCVVCGSVVIFSRFGGAVRLVTLDRRCNRRKATSSSRTSTTGETINGTRLSTLVGTIGGTGIGPCSFRPMNRAASALASRRRGTGVHGYVRRYVHNSIFRVIIDHEFIRHCRKSSFGLCHTLHDVGPSPCLFCFSFNNFHVFNSSPRARGHVMKRGTFVSPVTKAAQQANSVRRSEGTTRFLHGSPGRGTRRIVLISLTQGSLDHGYRGIGISFCGSVRFCDRIVRLIDHIDKALSRGTSRVGRFVSAFPTNALDNTPGIETVRVVSRLRPRGHNTCNKYVKFVKLGNSLGRTVMVHAFVDHGNRL